jgi:hypothetical protein
MKLLRWVSVSLSPSLSLGLDYGFSHAGILIAYICFLFGALHLVYIFAVSAMKDLEGGVVLDLGNNSSLSQSG